MAAAHDTAFPEYVPPCHILLVTGSFDGMHPYHDPGLDFVGQFIATDDSAEREPICQTLTWLIMNFNDSNIDRARIP